MNASPQEPTLQESAAPVSATAALRFRERVRSRSGGSTLLVFEVGGERFAVELQAVDEAVESPVLHPLPDGPRDLLGVIALRGALLPLFSPAEILGLSARASGVALVMRSGARRIALAVDEVHDVTSVSFAELRDAPASVNGDDLVVGLLLRDGALTSVMDARALVGICSHVAVASIA